MKRAFDFTMALTLLVLLSPIFLAITAGMLVTQGRPILYRGRRLGRHARPFDILKFRTMVQHAEQIGGSSTPEDDPRVTPLGHFLRRWKLDELPQLLNVVRGEMAVVGPRPQVEWAVLRLTVEEQAILSIRPGITDWASIRFVDEASVLKGSDNPDEAYMRLIHPHKTKLALHYVRSQTLGVDLRILWWTVLAASRIKTAGRLPQDIENILHT